MAGSNRIHSRWSKCCRFRVRNKYFYICSDYLKGYSRQVSNLSTSKVSTSVYESLFLYQCIFTTQSLLETVTVLRTLCIIVIAYQYVKYVVFSAQVLKFFKVSENEQSWIKNRRKWCWWWITSDDDKHVDNKSEW